MGSHKQVCQKHFQLSKVSTTKRTFWLYFAFVSYESNQTMLWPAVHHRKDTTHKTLSTICIHKMCNNNIKFIEMLGVNGSNVWQVSSQQHATTYNSMCKWTQHVTSNNVVSICTGLNLSSAPILLVLFNLERKEREGEVGSHFFIFITLCVLNLFNFLCRCNRLTVFSLFDLIQSCEPRLI